VSRAAEPARAHKRWFLSRQITLWFALVTSLLGLLFLSLGLWAVHTAVESQVRALCQEELEEMAAQYRGSDGSLEDFEAAAHLLAGEHPSNPMLWLLWQKADGEVVREVGRPELAVPTGARRTPGYERHDGHLGWAVAGLTSDFDVGVLIDGSAQFRLRDRYLVAATFMLLVSVLVSFLTSAWLGSRIARLMHRAAAGVRAAQHAPLEAVDAGPEAPEEVREVAQALQETLRAIQREVEGSRLLASGLAHELRSPIQNLLGEAEVALLRERTLPEYRRLLESQLEELRDLARAVDNLVTLCAVGESRRSNDKERFDLQADLPLRLSRETALAARRGVRLEVEAQGALALEGDREAILLALRNVVTNAIDWSGEDGVVQVRLASQNGQLEILVDDNGPGVPPAEREVIFKPFHHGPTPARRRSGYGLGLALTRTAVEAHGGTIEVSSSPLGGARFRIVLPSRNDAG
jgi:two-component system, OmpR family, heavy metal sensor histidine kinase CusS